MTGFWCIPVAFMLSAGILISPPVFCQDSYYLSEEGWLEAIGERFAEHPSFGFVERDTSLPDVLLIGNSISIGYTPYVREALKGKANVYRIPENGGDTRRFLTRYEFWLSTIEWDLIHINIGLHDLKRLDENGELNVCFDRRIPPDQYETNLDSVFHLLRDHTDARIIWATTTHIPRGSQGRLPGDEILYNLLSIKVLEKYPEFLLNDLHRFSLEIKSLQREANVHYSSEGSGEMGKHVAGIILEHLPGQ